jgi:hypothetical protein
MNKKILALGLILLSLSAMAEEPKVYNQYNRNDLTDYRNNGKGYWLLFLIDRVAGKEEPKPEWMLKKPVIEIGQLEYNAKTN